MTEDGDIPEDDDALAAEYALGLLSGTELAEVVSRLDREGALRARVAFWQEEFASLTETVPEALPPRDLWRRIEAELPSAHPVRRRRLATASASVWRTLTFVATAAAAAMAAVLLLDIEAFRPTAPDEAAIYAGEIRAGDGSLRLVAAYDAETGALRLARAEGLAAPGRALELWAIAEGADPVSLGVLPEDERAVVQVPSDLRTGFGDITLAVSDEPPGGSPTGQPTGDVLAVGGITEL